MLSLEFFAQNIHFAVSLGAALVFFAVFWLYFDAWLARKHKYTPDTLKWVGFLLASISFVVYATVIEQSNLGNSIFGSAATITANSIRLVGFLIIIAGELLDPLQERPSTSTPLPAPDEPTVKKSSKKPKNSALVISGMPAGITCFLPLAALAIAALYWRRATIGLERHVRPVAIAFLLMFGFELFSLSTLLRGTANPMLYDLVKAFGPLWVAAHACLFASSLLLGWWVWRYLTERFLSQLFMIFTGTILCIFLVTTVCFTFLLLHNVQDDALHNLSTAAHVLNYALNSQKTETAADAEIIANNSSVIQAITAKDNKSLSTLTANYLENKHLSSLVITTADPQVLLRAEDPSHWGDSLSSDTLTRRALIGEASSTVEQHTGVLAPVISIRSVVPVRGSDGTIVGTVSAAETVNNAFVDGIKNSTGLDTAVYSGNVRSATTLTTADGTSRWIGVKESNAAVQSTVLQHGATFTGQLDILGRQYLSVYAPLKDADNTVIGMLFIGQPAAAILRTTAQAIELTFILATLLLVLSIIPAYLVSRYIARQLE